MAKIAIKYTPKGATTEDEVRDGVVRQASVYVGRDYRGTFDIVQEPDGRYHVDLVLDEVHPLDTTSHKFEGGRTLKTRVDDFVKEIVGRYYI